MPAFAAFRQPSIRGNAAFRERPLRPPCTVSARRQPTRSRDPGRPGLRQRRRSGRPGSPSFPGFRARPSGPAGCAARCCPRRPGRLLSRSRPKNPATARLLGLRGRPGGRRSPARVRRAGPRAADDLHWPRRTMFCGRECAPEAPRSATSIAGTARQSATNRRRDAATNRLSECRLVALGAGRPARPVRRGLRPTKPAALNGGGTTGRFDPMLQVPRNRGRPGHARPATR